MCSVENTVIYAVFGIKSVQNSGFCSVFKARASKKIQCRDRPKPLKTPLFTLFSSILPCANAAGQFKHIYKKSFKNIVFFSVFNIFSVKNAVIYTFFGLKSVQNNGFWSVFNALAADQNDPKFRFNGLLSSDTQKSSEKRADTTLPRSRCEIPVSVRNRFCPLPPAKADIATAILTNVIKHLV